MLSTRVLRLGYEPNKKKRVASNAEAASSCPPEWMPLHWPSVFLTCAAFILAGILKSALTTSNTPYALTLLHITTPVVVYPSTAPAAYSAANPAPTPMALDVEAYPVAPEELELRQVHVYVRHGEYEIVVGEPW